MEEATTKVAAEETAISWPPYSTANQGLCKRVSQPGKVRPARVPSHVKQHSRDSLASRQLVRNDVSLPYLYLGVSDTTRVHHAYATQCKLAMPGQRIGDLGHMEYEEEASYFISHFAALLYTST